MINLRRITWVLVLGILLGFGLPAQSPGQAMKQISLEFSPERIDGYVAYRARAVYESDLDPATLMERLAEGNRRLEPGHPRMVETRVLDSWSDGFRVYQKFEVKIVVFTDSTEMILDFDSQWQGPTGVFSWYIAESPDGKMVDSRGSWTIRPISGSDIHQGPSRMEYEVTTIFRRTDYIFQQLVETFARGEIAKTLRFITRRVGR